MITIKIQSAGSYSLRAGIKTCVSRHALAQLEVVVEGVFVLIRETGEQVLQPGSWVWLAPHVPHGWRSQTPVRCLTFKGPMLDQRTPHDTIPLIARPASTWIASFPERILQLWMTGESQAREVASQLLSAALWMGMQSSKPGMESGLNEKWRELIGELRQPSQTSLTLPEMAKRVHLSPAHFWRQFKEHFSTSPGHYRLERRMEWARDMLQYTSIPIKEIGFQLGYCDLAAFSKAFAKHWGRRPRKFRLGSPIKKPTLCAPLREGAIRNCAQKKEAEPTSRTRARMAPGRVACL